MTLMALNAMNLNKNIVVTIYDIVRFLMIDFFLNYLILEASKKK